MPSRFSVAKQWFAEWCNYDSAGIPSAWTPWWELLSGLERHAGVISTESAGGIAFSTWQSIPWELQTPLRSLALRWLPPARAAVAKVLRLTPADTFVWRSYTDGRFEVEVPTPGREQRIVIQALETLGGTPDWLPRSTQYWWEYLFGRRVVAMTEFLLRYGAASWRALVGPLGRYADSPLLPDEGAAWFILAHWWGKLLGLTHCFFCGHIEPLTPGKRVRGSALAAKAGYCGSVEYRGKKVTVAPWVCKRCLNAFRDLVHGKTPGYERQPRRRRHQLAIEKSVGQFLLNIRPSILRCLRQHSPPFD